MKKIMFLLIILMSLFISACQSENSEAKTQNTKDEKYTNIEVLKLKSTNFDDFLKVIGTVKPIQQANLSFKTGGTIQNIYVEKGSNVAKGDTLISADTRMLKATLNSAKAQFDLAKVAFEKQAAIYKDKVGSEFQYLQAKYQMEMAKGNYEMAKSQFEDAFLIAPFPGKLDARYFDKGEFAAPSQPVVTIVQLNPLKVLLGVSENFANKIQKRMKVDFVSRELSEISINGTISYVGSIITTANRTFPVEVQIENRNNHLKPEMLLEARIKLSTENHIFEIPEEVLKRNEKGYFCFIEENGIAIEKPISLLKRVDKKAIINSGLKEGNKVIVVGYEKLIQGEKVKIGKWVDYENYWN